MFVRIAAVSLLSIGLVAAEQARPAAARIERLERTVRSLDAVRLAREAERHAPAEVARARDAWLRLDITTDPDGAQVQTRNYRRTGQAPAAQPPAGTPPTAGGQGTGRGAPGDAGQASGRGQGRGRGRGGPQILPFESRDGFEQIFDGTTMKGWDGDPKYWRVEAGAIVGETTAENKLTENTFVIWRGGEPADFELKLEYRINATNSGIQVRSVHLPAGTQAGGGGPIEGKWVLKGYQADIDIANRYTGQIYEERGRGFLAMRGQFSYIPEGGGPKVVGALQTTPDALQGIIKNNDWNQVHIIARGNMITEILNGHVTSVLVDDDTKGRALKGLIGFQVHTGDPMKVEFRNVWLKKF